MDFMWSLIYCALKSEYFKAAVLKRVKLERARLEYRGLTFYIALRNACEMLFFPVCASKFPVLGCSCAVPSCPIDLWGCRSSWAHLLQAVLANMGVNIYPSMEAVTGISALL